MSVAAPTIEASLDGRFISGLKDERVKAAKFYDGFGVKAPTQMVSLSHLLSPSTCMFSTSDILQKLVGGASGFTSW